MYSACRLARLTKTNKPTGRGGLPPRLHQAWQRSQRIRHELVAAHARQMNAVSPLETIGRGYAVLTAAETGEVVSRVAQVGKGDEVTAQLSDGFVDLSVNRTRKS